MNTLSSHPVFNRLANTDMDFRVVELDDEELNRVMDLEHTNPSILGVRVIKARGIQPMVVKEITGTLTSRLRAMMSDVAPGLLLADFRERIVDHPAYDLVVAEVQNAYHTNQLNALMDSVEAIGVEMACDRKEGVITIGLNAKRMNSQIREYTPMHSSDNRRGIAIANGKEFFDGKPVGKEPRHVEHEDVGMGTTYYFSFKI